MECLMKEMLAAKQVVSGGGGTTEDFFVDQLLNLDDILEEEEEEEKDHNGVLVAVKEEAFEEIQPLLSPARLETNPDRNADDFGSVLSVPAEEADLEWLSQFVEESFSTPYPTVFGSLSEKPKPESEPEPELGPEPPKALCFTPLVSLSKARRSKRARSGCRVWSAGVSEPASSSSSTTTTSCSPPSDSNPNPTRKQRKRENGSGGSGPPRRCSHCGVQKTPQWRAGPYGPKTLCNACGVRYKSGRLLPEYRPACSPTFSSELHSNNHRKVLEMRRKKEMTMSGQPDPVPSFG